MSSRLLIRLLVAAIMLTPALPAVTFAQNDGEVVVIEDNFDDPGAGVLQEGRTIPICALTTTTKGYEIDAFADDFAGDLTVPVPGEFRTARLRSMPRLTGDNDSNGHYLFLACRVRDDTGYKLEVRPLAQVAAIWMLSPDGNERIASVGLEGDPEFRAVPPGAHVRRRPAHGPRQRRRDHLGHRCPLRPGRLCIRRRCLSAQCRPGFGGL